MALLRTLTLQKTYDSNDISTGTGELIGKRKIMYNMISSFKCLH